MSVTGPEPSEDDIFHVIAISNQDHLQGSPDPVTVFIMAATAHGEQIVQRGLRYPQAFPVWVEVYSLSSIHRDQFPIYGVNTPAPRSGTDLMYTGLYFFNEEAYALARRLGVALPAVKKSVTRKDLPEEKGSPIGIGNKFWDAAQ
jgi:hypothetical protein